MTLGQEQRKLIQGIVLLNKNPIFDVHVVNKNSNQGTISNDFGEFEIPVVEGDTLQFKHINLEVAEIFITKNHFENSKIEVHLDEKTYALNEITLEKQKSIFYVDPQIMPPPTVNAKTLNLPYANVKVKKDYDVLKIRSGAVVSLDNLLNSLNGNNKRRKELQKVTLEDSELVKIRKHFTDDFFITDLNIKQENIYPFLNYCLQKNIIGYFKANNTLKLTRILMAESKTFPLKEESEIRIVQKN
ncbi:MAG: carboxypeptidase-like regulatory domain-containing protein [Polaribacter sp.]|uniref:carboxypeptidase-like regulatory domain-containing protein n=1 Tax=Polaribacter sp. TaxID=1920175 RepID=UPI003BAFA1E7